ncbi:hypothetical protein ACFXHK_17130, partial [Embleya sp. NPDC059267]|uniref:hypothetical protein n=1 Tax=Embleya sp. NPDC059267 TaxID=3346798 RepID=UPI0036A0D3CF
MVAATLLMSLGVVLLLGFVVISAVKNGLLYSKVEAAAYPVQEFGDLGHEAHVRHLVGLVQDGDVDVG